jgi:hypothetical protein
MKIVVVLDTGDTVIRMSDDEADVLAAISVLSRRVLEARPPGDRVVRVLVSCDDLFSLKGVELPRCTNLCGKITHLAAAAIYSPGVQPYVRRTKNLFGNFTCVYSTHANFHTGAARSSTLFRGGSNTQNIKGAIAHIFMACYVHSVLVHNCVFTGNLGVPVSRSNAAVQQCLAADFECRALPLAAVCDENMFAISLLLKDFRTPLVAVAAGDSPVASVRVNICRTGVLNIFVAAPGGVDARTHLDETLLPVAHRLFAAIARVV